jgi:tetratricopeptide (TPR) repeat protein
MICTLSENIPKVCLNMIVKNESKIILRLLQSVLPFIDSYCICDTGSTDDTIHIIESFFAQHNKSGKIVSEPFQDFGYNRSFALKQCYGMPNADYILLLDADMVLRINPHKKPEDIKRQLIHAAAFFLFQGVEQFFYKNFRIVKNVENIEYWGVTHEYLKLPDNFTNALVIEREDLFIIDVGDGGCKSDKYERDIALLKKGLEQIPDNDRYTFYLANSYRDVGDYTNAIETYKKRIQIGGWYEEVWFSMYSIGNCYKSMGDYVHAIHFWLEAYNFFPTRIENLYEIITYYRQCGKNNLAYQFYVIAANERNKIKVYDYLFLKKEIYDCKLDYELTIIGYYTNVNVKTLSKTCMKVLAYPHLDESSYKNVFSNYKFYSPVLKDMRSITEDVNIETMKNVGRNIIAKLPDGEHFCSSTPSICYGSNDTTLILNMRYVDYKIKEDGNYENREHITTHNVMSTIDISSPIWKIKKEYLLEYNHTYDNVYVGLEDVRLLFNKELKFNANRGLGWGNMVVEHGTILPTGDVQSTLLKIEGQTAIEKNWVMFTDIRKATKMIYGWHPLVIGEANAGNDVFTIQSKFPSPPFFKSLRGSTNGVKIGNEIWFICHAVSYEERRYYYHIFVVLDASTYHVKKYTPFFTFTKEKVEYTLGFVYAEKTGNFLIGYSVLDKTTDFMHIKKKTIDDMLI